MAPDSAMPFASDLSLPPLEKGSHSRRLNLIAVIATFGGLLFGYDTGVLNGALSYIADYFHLTPLQEGFVAFSLLIGATIGAFVGGPVSDGIGRKITILGLAGLFLSGAAGCTLAPSYKVLIVFRFVLGLAVGGASVTVPVYLAEIAPMESRGSIVGRNDLMIVIGVSLAFLFNAIIGNLWGTDTGVWRYMLALAILPAMVLLIGMLSMPESPRWLVSRGRGEEALAVLKTVRSVARAEAEMAEVRELALFEQQQKSGSWSEIFHQHWLFQILCVGTGLAAFQQLTGINAIMYYGTQVLEQAGFTRHGALTFNVLNGVISIVAMAINVALVNRINRRSFLVYGFLGVALLHIFVGAVGTAMPVDTLRSYLLTFGIVALTGWIQGSMMIPSWIVISEIYPLKMRGLMIGISVAMLWLTNALVSLGFPPIANALGFGTFFLFAAACTFAALFIQVAVPETRGKTLERIEEEIMTKFSGD